MLSIGARAPALRTPALRTYWHGCCSSSSKYDSLPAYGAAAHLRSLTTFAPPTLSPTHMPAAPTLMPFPPSPPRSELELRKTGAKGRIIYDEE